MKRKYIIILSILILLIAIRITLPFWVTKYLNKMLDDLPGYSGSIEDVDLHIYRGAYSIENIKIFKEGMKGSPPFFESEEIDISIQWSEIFKGALVGELFFTSPKINFLDAQEDSQKQYGKEVDWTQTLKNLLPIRINKLTVNEGYVFFKNFQSKPQVNLYLNAIFLEATNLSNVSSKEHELPSKLLVSATSIGGGKLQINGKMNLLKKTPDMDLDLKFENVDLPALNNFLKSYLKVDAEQGKFNLYSEIALKDQTVNGYIKPLLTNIKMVKWENDKDQLLELIWESIVGVFLEIFENQKKDQFATKIPLSGNLKDPDTKVLPAIWNIFSNAFVKAFEKKTDNTIHFNSD